MELATEHLADWQRWPKRLVICTGCGQGMLVDGDYGFSCGCAGAEEPEQVWCYVAPVDPPGTQVFGGRDLADLAILVLDETNLESEVTQVHYEELVTMIGARGYAIGGAVPKNTLLSVLARDRRWRKVVPRSGLYEVVGGVRAAARSVRAARPDRWPA